MENNRYYLGLDMGTSSVGWAVTDEHYNLLRKKGKDLWGIREFEEAKTSEERRQHRISRRRRQREVVRRNLIKTYFADAIEQVDKDFLQRLENSKYHLEDKDENVRYKNGIFNDNEYGDADYYSEYPTIFHLRRELIRNKEPHDVRLVYLAVLNIFKHRGHFLNAGLEGSSNRKMEEVYLDFANAIDSYNVAFDTESLPEFDKSIETSVVQEILGDRTLSRTEKAERLQELLHTERKEKKKVAFIKLLCGLKVDVKILFDDIETEEKRSICFSDIDFDETKEELEALIGEEQFRIVMLAKEINDIGLLSSIMKGYEYLSEARVADYEKHGTDLKLLKALIRKYAGEETYNKVFRAKGDGSYSAYINSVNAKDVPKKLKRRKMKGRKRDDFYTSLKKILKDMPQDDEDVKQVIRDIETESFLPKQLTASNGVIPNQVHKAELNAILENAASYLPFLNDIDDSGLTVKERIIQLFAFQIPYYVGPTTENSAALGGNGWVVRTEAGDVLPWNITEKIDLNATYAGFIDRLIRDCTYIAGEKVLPKSSLKYERYCVLNEINNIKIDGEKISVELKQDIFRDLFEQGKKVTRDKLFKYLRNRGLVEEKEQISGIDITINNYLSSYGKFYSVFGEKLREDHFREMVEEIIYWGTVFGDDKKYILKNIKEKYADEIDEAQLKRITGFKFKDWGRLSNEFLKLQGCNKQTGEVLSLLEALWSDESNMNLMELLNSDMYSFKEELKEKGKQKTKPLSEFTHDDLNDMYFSAPVKRMIWQTLLLIDEIKTLCGAYPARIFIEMARSDEEKGNAGRKDSRKKQLQELYKRIQGESASWKKEMQGLIEKEDESGRLRSKKMYLYFTQMGRCMYTGKPINLDELFNDNLYDIDHIYPRHFVKDDNINNNLVLVYKPQNAHKSDNYPIEGSIRNNEQIRALWRKLKESGLITEEKYRRLTGTQPFTDEQLAGFIARQMVETRQGTKGVADLLKELLPEGTEIVYAKAGNVSEFRKKNDIVKCRSVNDFHHAHDAYLNIVVGNAYLVKFTKSPKNFILQDYRRDEKANHYNLSSMFKWDIKRGGETAWIAAKGKEPGTIAIVLRTIQRNTPILTRMNFTGHGGIADQTLYGSNKAKPEAYIPLKASDPKMTDVEKYGGFSSVSTAYFFLVEHGKEGKRIRTLETVPIYLANKIERDESVLLDYCKEQLCLIEPSIRVRKIKIQSLIKRNGYFMHVAGKTEGRLVLRNAVNMCLADSWVKYIHYIEKYMERGIIDERITATDNKALFEELVKKHSSKIYISRPNPIKPMIEEGLETFKALTIEEQIKTLYQIIQLSKIGDVRGDLRNINGSASSGTMKCNKKITGCREVKLINQSVTGVFENVVDLLTV